MKSIQTNYFTRYFGEEKAGHYTTSGPADIHILRVSVSKNQRNHGHGQKIDFAHTLSVCRPRYVTERYEVGFF